MKQKDKSDKKSLTKLKSFSSLITLKYNSNFCNNFFEKNKIGITVDEPSYSQSSGDLIYNLPKAPELNFEAFQTIIDLLLQLRASQSDQNIFVQNNTVLRENILKQLKSEVLRVSHKLTSNQIKNLEVVSSNNFDEDALTDLIRSFLKKSKKKLDFEKKSRKNDLSQKKIDQFLIQRNFLKNKQTVNELEKHEKILEKVSNKFVYKNAPVQILPQENEETKNFENKKVKKSNFSKLIENPLVKNFLIKKAHELEIPYEVYENVLTKNSKLISPLLKVQSEIFEEKILNRVKSFSRKIINNNISKILPSEEQIVNKVIYKTQINELKQELSQNYERYDYYTSKHQTEIRRIQTELKKFQKIASVTYDKNYLIKTASTIDLNTKSKIQKNIIKLVSGNELVNKFENISENFFQNYLQKKSTKHNNFINKIFENKTKRNVNRVLNVSTNLKHRLVNIKEENFNDFEKNEVVFKDINKKYLSSRNIHKNLLFKENENVNKQYSSKINLKSYFEKTFEKTNNFIKNKTENEILKNATYFKIKDKKILNKKFHQIHEIINWVSKTSVLKNSLNFINQHTKIISNNLKSERLKKFYDKTNLVNMNFLENFENQKKHIENTDIFKKITSSEIEKNVITNKIIKNTKNINLIKSPLVFSSLSTIIDSKNNSILNKPLVLNNSKELIFKTSETDLKLGNISKNNYSKAHIVYKQNLKQEKTSEKEKLEKPEEKPRIIVEKKSEPITSQVLDIKSIDKRIKEKTLSKNEIVNLIQSYLQEINIENISGIILDRIEDKMLMDRKRNGIF